MEVEVRHILCATPAEAEAVAKKARGGASFAALAKTDSLDAATAADGGRMAPAVYGEVIPDLEDIVFRMRVGEIGGPIKSKFGYHVLRKDGQRPLELAQAHDRIAQILEKQKLDRYLQSVMEKYPVEVVDEQFK
jgi:foldase protein PrsA